MGTMRIPPMMKGLKIETISRSIGLGALICCLLTQIPDQAYADTAEARDSRVIMYRCLAPRDHTLLYRLGIQETLVGRDGNTERIEVEQTWQWPSGNHSLYRDILMMDPAQGRAVSGLRKEYNGQGSIILETKINIEADTEAFPPNTFPYTSLFTVNRRGIKSLIQSERFEFQAIFPGKVVVRLHSRFSGKEQVKISGKTVDCYKVQMSPDMSYFMGRIGRVVNLFVRLLMPESCMWFLAEPPYTLIRYKGLSSVESSIQSVIYEIEETALHGNQSDRESNEAPDMVPNDAVMETD